MISRIVSSSHSRTLRTVPKPSRYDRSLTLTVLLHPLVSSGSAERGQAARGQALPHGLGRSAVQVRHDLEVARGVGSARRAREQETGEPRGALEAFQELPGGSIHGGLLRMSPSGSAFGRPRVFEEILGNGRV